MLEHTAVRLKYNKLIRTSIGAEQMEKKFLARKRSVEEVMSASDPKRNVIVPRVRPTTVRY